MFRKVHCVGSAVSGRARSGGQPSIPPPETGDRAAEGGREDGGAASPRGGRSCHGAAGPGVQGLPVIAQIDWSPRDRSGLTVIDQD